LNARLAHRGICVSDLARSTAFYRELGFTAGALEHHTGAALSAAYGAPIVQWGARLVTDAAGTVLALQEFHRPDPVGPRTRRPNNRFGLTHLAFYVDDIGGTAAALERAGGEAHWHTRAVFPEGDTEMMYCTDPDGTRIELMHSPSAAPRFSHSGICVDDLARARRFYREGLGFDTAELYALHDHSSWLDVINELHNVKLTAQMIRDARAQTLELLHIVSPPCSGPQSPPPLNQLGFTHLAFHVDDLEKAVAAVQAGGGTASLEYRCRQFGSDSVFCTDPHGVRLLLLQTNESARWIQIP
jgi:catechol 2,3-dioxygenase-like lactoylglutathione lyase family enzyme